MNLDNRIYTPERVDITQRAIDGLTEFIKGTSFGSKDAAKKVASDKSSYVYQVFEREIITDKRTGKDTETGKLSPVGFAIPN